MLLDTPKCNTGWIAPDFILSDTNGMRVKMTQHLGAKGLVVAFVSNTCPNVQDMARRFAADAAVLKQEGIGVLAIMSNDYRRLSPSDGPTFMRQFAMRYGWAFPYLIDDDQRVGRAWGAVCTPDFFGLNGDGVLQYRGRLDNLTRAGGGARKAELVDAMRLIAKTGKGPEDQKPSMGCAIKWRR